jgi:hypothetical protein
VPTWYFAAHEVGRCHEPSLRDAPIAIEFLVAGHRCLHGSVGGIDHQQSSTEQIMQRSHAAMPWPTTAT